MWPYARRRRRPWPLLLALLQSTALLTPRPVLRGPRPLRSTPADLQPRTGGAGNRPLRSTPANVEPRTESGGNKKPPPKFTPKAFGSDKKYANPREAHRAAAKMRKDAEAAKRKELVVKTLKNAILSLLDVDRKDKRPKAPCSCKGAHFTDVVMLDVDPKDLEGGE